MVNQSSHIKTLSTASARVILQGFRRGWLLLITHLLRRIIWQFTLFSESLNTGNNFPKSWKDHCFMGYKAIFCYLRRSITMYIKPIVPLVVHFLSLGLKSLNWPTQLNTEQFLLVLVSRWTLFIFSLLAFLDQYYGRTISVKLDVFFLLPNKWFLLNITLPSLNTGLPLTVFLGVSLSTIIRTSVVSGTRKRDSI